MQDYEFWCTASNLHDENVIAAKFAFCFTGDLREAVIRSYNNQQTWAAMKQECLQLLEECSTVTAGDYSSARTLFDGTDTYQKYEESISMFKMRWDQIVGEYTQARQTHGLAPYGPRDELIEFQRRILPNMHSHLLKHRNSVNSVGDAVRVIRTREQYNRDVKAAQQQRAAMSVDPGAEAIRAASSFGSDAPPASARAASAACLPSGRAQPYAQSPLLVAPARVSLHGQPNAQLESTATVRTKVWDTQALALEKAMKEQTEKFQEMQKQMERLGAEMQERVEQQAEELRRLKAGEKKPEASGPRAASLKHVAFADMADGQVRVPFPPEELPDNVKCYVSMNSNGFQWCLWHNTADHNTTSCSKVCCRCGEPHSVYVCPTPHNDVKCGNCGRKGHVQRCCIWAVLGDFRRLSSHGAQANPNSQRPFQHNQINFGQQQYPYGQPPGNSFQGGPPMGGPTHHGQGPTGTHDRGNGYNRHNKRKFHHAVHGKSLNSGEKTPDQKSQKFFQPAVLNKKLKENNEELIAKLTDITKRQVRQELRDTQDRFETRLMKAITDSAATRGGSQADRGQRRSRSSQSPSSRRRSSSSSSSSSARRPN